MAYNPIQFQQGMSLPDFIKCFGTEAACAEVVRRALWPDGFVCPGCERRAHCVVVGQGRCLYQCHACQRQTSLTACTLFDNTKLPLTRWLQAIYLISRVKTGLPALELKRHISARLPDRLADAPQDHHRDGHYLGTFAYGFNRRFDLANLAARPIADVRRSKPAPERVIRHA